MDICQQKKKLKIEFAHSLFKCLCTNDKYIDVFDDTTDKITKLICSIMSEFPEGEDYIASYKWTTNKIKNVKCLKEHNIFCIFAI